MSGLDSLQISSKHPSFPSSWAFAPLFLVILSEHSAVGNPVFVFAKRTFMTRTLIQPFLSRNSYVELATRRIAAIATSSKIVVEKSTVPCRTAESMRTILEANSKPNARFDILSNPEFLAEGTAIDDLFRPDRVLIGSLQSPEGIAACASLAEVYANWVP